ncbi:MAG TPA: prenyltransferase/squalene oxidase repeat-containing protein [Vicinamibacteria bacterium]|nr:prenyltransferase/squalene oxidase repeat-containing protein [Vicinamibacteria bacterium]
MALLALLFVVLAPVETPELRAIEFLAREVPKWPRENGCFSCHNNGDAARALIAAKSAGLSVPDDSLSETLDWLARPKRWDDKGGGGGFDDAVLARIQFASALASAVDAGLIEDRSTLERAAEIVASDQGVDGSWRLDASASLGSPATYGRPLATAVAKRVLEKADRKRHADAVRRASDWLQNLEVQTVVDAAAVLIGVDTACGKCVDIIGKAQAPSGGWGPHLVASPEPFDTALVMLALEGVAGGNNWIEDGRRFLLERQLEDGSWPETTRPAGQQSYAQYISTTGWATLALLSTRSLR